MGVQEGIGGQAGEVGSEEGLVGAAAQSVRIRLSSMGFSVSFSLFLVILSAAWGCGLEEGGRVGAGEGVVLRAAPWRPEAMNLLVGAGCV